MEYIIAAVLALFGFIGVYFKGRRDQTKKNDAERIKGQLAAERKRNETNVKAGEVDRDVEAITGNDARERLRDKWTRDN